MRRFNSEIDVELLRRYYQGDMNGAEKNALEKRALDDPFLREAMEGFDQHPGSFDLYYAKYKEQLQRPRSYTLITALGVLILLFIVSYSVKFTPKDDSSDLIAENNDSILVITPTVNLPAESQEQTEIEIISPEIESLEEIQGDQLISSEQLKEKNDLIHEKVDSIKKIEPKIELIEIEESGYDPEYDMVVENWSRQGQEVMPTVYLYNLMIVDYRGLKRERDQITYKRYDLSGTSANMENDSIFRRNDLTETEVEMPYYIYLSKSMDFFSKNRFKKALNRYQIILEQYPKDQNALFYGALCFYNLGSYKKCNDLLENVKRVSNSPFKEDALWYQAKCAMKGGEKQKAIRLLEDIITEGGFYMEDAMALRKELME